MPNVSQKDGRVICLALVSLSYICTVLCNKLTFTVTYWVQTLALECGPWTQLRDKTTWLFKAPGLPSILQKWCAFARLVARNKQSLMHTFGYDAYRRHLDLCANQ